MAHVEIGPEDAIPSDASKDGPAAASRGEKALLAFFWVWATLLVVATLAHLFGWQGVLDALDVKRWFAR